MEVARTTGFTYDTRMTLHQHSEDRDHVEGPLRITVPYNTLQTSGLLDNCLQIESRLASEEELLLVHTKEYVERIKGLSSHSDAPLSIPERWPTYACEDTYTAACCAVGSLLNMTDAVCSGKVSNGVALIRPPGHHAEVAETCGFCFFNSVSIAARHALRTYSDVNKVLIVDWDIHHGNGVQHIFYDDPSVFYISMHRYDSGEYFPHLREANTDSVGQNEGAGLTMNIAWNKDKMGNAEYRAAFESLVMPAANQFKPDLVLVVCGFDAAAADPLGQYVVTSDMFAYMTHRLMTLASGKVILELEGGYNPKNIGECLTQCMEVLCGVSAPPTLGNLQPPCKRAKQTIHAVKRAHAPYWKFDS